MIKKDYTLLSELILEAHTGVAISIKKGNVLRITDLEGSQVVDLVSYNEEDPREYLSSPRTMDYASKIYFSSGDLLYSDQSRVMWTILEDAVGKHCFLFAPCDQVMFEKTYQVNEPHPNCFENLGRSLSPFGIQPEQIFIPFNLFMHAKITEMGQIEILPPLSKAGDYIDLRSEMDMFVGISACSAYKANNYSFGPVHVQVFYASRA